MERDVVAELDPGVPLPGGTRTGDQREQRGDARAQQADVGPDHVVEALDELLFRPCGTEARGDAIGDRQVRPQDDEEPDGEDEPEDELRAQHPAEDARQVDLAEPEIVRVEAGQPPDRKEDQKDDRRDDDEAHSPARPAGAARQVAGSSHGRRLGGEEHAAAAGVCRRVRLARWVVLALRGRTG